MMGPVPIPNSYEEAINDPMYGRHLLEAAKNETYLARERRRCILFGSDT